MTLQLQYPWTTSPTICCAPMRLIALAPLAVQVSAAGGFGFIGAGDNLKDLDNYFSDAAHLIRDYPELHAITEKNGVLPIGFGFFNWAAPEDLDMMVKAVGKWSPAAAWMFGAYRNADYATLAARIRGASAKTKVWVQVGSVADAIEVARDAKPDVLVVQGADAGGHGLEFGAGVFTLLPEVADAMVAIGLPKLPLVAAGGIVDGRGVAAALVVGADGVTLGTRFLASDEATIATGYRKEVVRATDGGPNTKRTKLYDKLRGTTLWPEHYNARGVINRSFQDHRNGMPLKQNKNLYDEAMKQGDSGWGLNGRITTYAGTGIGLIKHVMKAGDIVREVQDQALRRLKLMSSKL